MENMIAKNITELRKKSEHTQEQLAEKLGVTFQAVSKWENNQSCPDIMLLPKLAYIFGVSIDTLFGRNCESESVLPWENDGIIRGVVFRGHELLTSTNEMSKFTFEYKGTADNVESRCNINCENINGAVASGGGINCGTITGPVCASEGVNCGNICGSVSCEGDINCGNIDGDVDCKGDIHCQLVKGDVICQSINK
jgi:transcriptional regulator with XRE-family HTH domain